jgi:hypothetical protein
MNSILIKTLHLLQMEHLQVKTSLQGMPSKCAVGNILYSWNYAYNDATIGDKKPSTLKTFLILKSFLVKELFTKVQCLT